MHCVVGHCYTHYKCVTLTARWCNQDYKSHLSGVHQQRAQHSVKMNEDDIAPESPREDDEVKLIKCDLKDRIEGSFKFKF